MKTIEQQVEQLRIELLDPTVRYSKRSLFTDAVTNILQERDRIAREDCVEIIKANTQHIQPLPENAEEFMGDFERGTVGGGEYVKRIILESLTTPLEDNK